MPISSSYGWAWLVTALTGNRTCARTVLVAKRGYSSRHTKNAAKGRVDGGKSLDQDLTPGPKKVVDEADAVIGMRCALRPWHSPSYSKRRL